MPKAFVSYSWDSQDHKHWVLRLSERLRSDGVDVCLDQWELAPGDQLPRFMEQAIRDNDFVLVVCTPQYKRKSDAREGGVGYEGDIMTAVAFTQGAERKFVPVLRRGQWSEAAPSWLLGKVYVDLRGEPYSGVRYDELVRALHDLRPEAPPIGAVPVQRLQIGSAVATGTMMTRTPPVSEGPIRVVGVIADEVGRPTLDGTPGSALYSVPFRLSRAASGNWADTFVTVWNDPPRFTSMHRPGIAYVSGDRVVLDGTTMEEVEKYHLETLRLVTEETNRIVGQAEKDARIRAEHESEQARQHEEGVRAVAGRLLFDSDGEPDRGGNAGLGDAQVRQAILQAFYDLYVSDGFSATMEPLAALESRGIPRAVCARNFDYLVAKGLLETVAYGGAARITVDGVDRVERNR